MSETTVRNAGGEVDINEEEADCCSGNNTTINEENEYLSLSGTRDG